MAHVCLSPPPLNSSAEHHPQGHSFEHCRWLHAAFVGVGKKMTQSLLPWNSLWIFQKFVDINRTQNPQESFSKVTEKFSPIVPSILQSPIKKALAYWKVHAWELSFSTWKRGHLNQNNHKYQLPPTVSFQSWHPAVIHVYKPFPFYLFIFSYILP